MRILIFIILVTILSCNPQTPSDLLIGSWKFEKIAYSKKKFKNVPYESVLIFGKDGMVENISGEDTIRAHYSFYEADSLLQIGDVLRHKVMKLNSRELILMFDGKNPEPWYRNPSLYHYKKL